MAAEILIAHENQTVAAEIEQALQSQGATMKVVSSGHAALSSLLRDHPRVMVVDVALPGRAPFELCDDIERAGLRTRVVLIASVYNRTRYKRRPTSLYGADDYVEQHHIHDMLPDKVSALRAGAQGRTEVPHRHDADPASLERLRHAADERFTITFTSPSEGRRRAARLAELLIADLALYNGDELERCGDPANPGAQLQHDLDEARSIFSRLVPETVRSDDDWIGAAFRDLVGRRQQQRARLSESGDG